MCNSDCLCRICGKKVSSQAAIYKELALLDKVVAHRKETI